LLTPVQHKLFRKDIKRDKTCGKYKKSDFEALKSVMQKLINGETLDQKLHDHSLDFEWSGYRECHIKPNWLLVYKMVDTQSEIIFVRLGTHTQIFDSY